MSGWKSRWSSDRLVKAADGEADAVDAAQRQRVAGHLHGDVGDAALGHHGQQGLQVGRLGGGERRPRPRSSPIMVATVPISPVVRPAARSPARIRNVVVVLPLVPVTPEHRAVASTGWP